MKKNKYLKLIVLLLIAFHFNACEDLLDIKPTNIISDVAVKNDPVLIQALYNNVHSSVRWHTGGNDIYMLALTSFGGEATMEGTYGAPGVVIDQKGAPAILEYWPYDNIRAANELMALIEDGNFDKSFKIRLSAETRFLRAYMYFELVKRYGGVPLITKPQNIDDPYEALFVKRNSEKEIYDFISAEMDAVSQVLTGNLPSSEYGRISKWAALALKSRAMLYAGSIAKYGSRQLDGLLGFSASEASSYFQKAYDASMEVINNSPHPLYKGNKDKKANYTTIFTPDGNPEVILAEIYDYNRLKVHSLNTYLAPMPFQGGWGSGTRVFREFANLYEDIDGSTNTLDISLFDGKTLLDINKLFGNKDPRFKASLFYPESPWQTGVVHFHLSTVAPDPSSSWPFSAPARNAGNGLQMRKRLNESEIAPVDLRDGSDFIIFRTGEMYMNAAEAAFQLQNTNQALSLINEIRGRAGIGPKTTLTIQDIQNERAVELAYEEHRYWDLRRWRIAVNVLNGKSFQRIEWAYNYPARKYTATLKPGEVGITRVFAERNYYLPIGQGRIVNNPNLVENPGYIQ